MLLAEVLSECYAGLFLTWRALQRARSGGWSATAGAWTGHGGADDYSKHEDYRFSFQPGSGGFGMSRVMCICPTHRDHRELAALNAGHVLLRHDYASDQLEDLTAPEPANVSIPETERELELLLNRCRDEKVEAVFSTDDYPGTTLASIAADNLELPGPRPSANLFCQHKFYSREIQAVAAPEATPDFQLLDVRDEAPMPAEERFPLFVKPVKSFFSVGAQMVESRKQLAGIKSRWAGATAFFRPFEILFKQHTGLRLGTCYLLAEEVLSGRQATLDGYVCNGQVHPVGVVDSIMFPNTIAFQRFDYPSALPLAVQERMAQAARKVMPALGFNDCQFNIEFMYNPQADAVHIIEINPRMSSQFADLFEKVDGTNSYEVLLDLALGRTPAPKHRQGQFRAASSCVLRTFQNQRVLKLPSAGEVARLERCFPGIRIELLATEGRKLSEQMQDTCSFRYGLLNIGGPSLAAILDIFEYCKRNLTFSFEPV